MKKIITLLTLFSLTVAAFAEPRLSKKQWLSSLPMESSNLYLWLDSNNYMLSDTSNYAIQFSTDVYINGALWIPNQKKKYFTTDASFNGLRLAYEQITSSITSGTGRGMELRVSTQKDVGGALRGAEIKAVSQNITGQSTVALLNGVYGNADGKDNIVTTMRAFEASLDQEAGGTCTEAVGIELFNNSSGSMTKSYGLSVNGGTSSGHKVYDHDIRFQTGLCMDNATSANLKVTDGTNTLFTVTDAGSTGDITASGDATISGGKITFGNGETIDNETDANIYFKDGTNTLFTITDAGTTGNVSASGSVTSGSSFIIGSADINETDLEKIDGITDGTAAANKALVCNATLDISGIRNLTCVSGTATDLTASNAVVTYGIAAGTAVFSGAIAATTLDTGQGANELYDMNQNVQTTDAVTFTTVDTGQGANELYDMNQNVLTTSLPTFDSLTLTYGIGSATGVFSGALSAAGITGTSFVIGANTLDTNEWAYLDGLNQALKTTSLPTFDTLTLTYGVGAATGVFSGALSAAGITGTSFVIGANTLDTNEWANLDGINQQLKTTSLPTFDTLTLTYGIGAATGVFSGALSAAGITGTSFVIGANTLDTNEWANLDGINQQLKTTSLPTFDTLSLTYGIGAATGVFSGALSAAGITGTSFVIGANTLDTNEWANLDGVNQQLKTTSLPTFDTLTLTYGLGASTGNFSGAITATTIDTGQGAKEVYSMNQDVQTSDSPTFVRVTASGGSYTTTDAVGNSIYQLIVSSVLPSTGEFTITPATGKAGGFDIIMGTHTARGSFDTSAVVTLTADGSGTATTSNGNADTLNVYDGGSVVIIENGAGPTYTAYIRYWFVN